MNIHWAIWIIIGAIVAVVSRQVGHLEFFFYVGLLFIVIGIAKLVIGYITGKGEKLAVKGSFCPTCRAKTTKGQKYCVYCGQKL